MKIFLLFFAQIFSTFAWDLDFEISENYLQELKISCSDRDSEFCYQSCDDEFFCSIEVPFCQNCLGNSFLMTAIFSEIGRFYKSSEELLELSDVASLLREKKFIILTSHIFYNIFDSTDFNSTTEKFQSLCREDEFREYTLVFWEYDSLELGDGLFVFCKGQFFKIEKSYDVILNL